MFFGRFIAAWHCLIGYGVIFNVHFPLGVPEIKPNDSNKPVIVSKCYFGKKSN